jgi:clan AA aspartic protease (TIGR02281 family)
MARQCWIPCKSAGDDALAAWQCQQFYSRQKINGYCLTVPGGDVGIRQCQQFYTHLSSSARPASEASTSALTPSVVSSVATSQAGPTNPASQRGPGKSQIPLKQLGGTFVISVTINNALQLAFIIDSGASDVSIPADVVLTLVRAGTITDTDFLGKRLYRLADGSTVPSQTFRIRSLTVGDRTLENVTGSVASASASLLLGQSFLSRFRSWSIDNQRMVLMLE